MIKAHCACGAKYSMPEQAAGRRAKCRKCGANFLVPAATGIDDGELHLADLESLREGSADQAAIAARAERMAAEHAAAAALSGHSLEKSPEELAGASGSLVAMLRDFGTAALFFLNGSSALTFVVVVIVAVAMQFASRAPCVGMGCAIIMSGWIMSFLLNTLGEAAVGEKRVAELTLTNGMFEDVFLPWLKFMISWLLASIPFLVTVIYMQVLGTITVPQTAVHIAGAMGGFGVSLFDPSMGGGVLLVSMLVATWAIWPVLVIAVTIGGFGDLVRIDLMAITIIRALPAFVVTLIAFLAFQSLPLLAMVATGLVAEQMLPPDERKMDPMNVIYAGCIVSAVNAYCMTASMMVLGYFYYHFKRRFAWDWG